MPAVGPDGELYVTWLDRGASQIQIRKSVDAGGSFTNPVNGGGPVQPILQIPGTLNGNIRANSFPSIFVDPEEGGAAATEEGDLWREMLKDRQQMPKLKREM